MDPIRAVGLGLIAGFLAGITRYLARRKRNGDGVRPIPRPDRPRPRQPAPAPAVGRGVLLLVLLYVAIDLHLPAREVAGGIPLDVALHFACFGRPGRHGPPGLRPRRQRLAAILFLLALGMFLEITQYYLPHRFFSLYDAGANVLGLAAGAIPGFLLLAISPPQVLIFQTVICTVSTTIRRSAPGCVTRPAGRALTKLHVA
jgi:hypothetical protein